MHNEAGTMSRHAESSGQVIPCMSTGNFPVGLVLLWGLKRGDFLAQKGAPKIGQKGAPQSPKPNGKLLMSTKKKMVRFTTSHTQKNNAG
jgi:hypothetical protein